MAQSKLFYGWVVTIASLCITTTSFGVFWSFGVFFKAWLTELSSSRAFLSGIFSVTFLMYGIASVLMGFFADRYGPRRTLAIGGVIMGAGCIITGLITNVWPLYLTWGIMVGIGVGTAYAPTVSTVSRWFVRRKGLAVGIVVSGLGLGTLIFSPLSEALIAHFEWRGAAVFLGFTILAVYFVGVLVIRRDPREIGLVPLGENSDSVKLGVDREAVDSGKEHANTLFQPLNLRQAMKTRAFWILFAVHGLWLLGLSMTMVHLVPYATDLGIATKRAANMLAVLGGMSVVGRVVLGVLTERLGSRASLITLLFFQTGTMVWLIASRSEGMLWAFVLLFGLSYGGLASIFPLATSEFFGLRAMGSIFGFILLGATVGGMVGPPLGGYIFDWTQNYYYAFLSGCLSMAIGAPLAMLLPRGANVHT